MSEIDILSFGETMAMFVAEQTGDLAHVAQFHKRIAGADSNVAIGLSRLGFNVAWLSRVGLVPGFVELAVLLRQAQAILLAHIEVRTGDHPATCAGGGAPRATTSNVAGNANG